MEFIDPATGKALPEDAIQRILFLAPKAHVYNIPPRPSAQGHLAAPWTAEPSRQIFTARLRVLETSIPSPADASNDDDTGADKDELKVDLVLEDAKTGALFAAAPYTTPTTVEPVLDSSRFFAVTVRDPQGRKAVLGIGFEDRSDAFDLGVALQEARRALGWEKAAGASSGHSGGSSLSSLPSSSSSSSSSYASGKGVTKDEPKDYSLKEGQTITVNLGNTGIGRRRAAQQATDAQGGGSSSGANLQSFALAPPPPPGGSAGFSLPPPPTGSTSAVDERRRKRQSAQDLGFDDGKFGEFA